MFNFFIALIFITSCLIIFMVLIQNTKEEGLGSSYLGDRNSGNRWVGVQSAGDILEQITWGLVTTLFVLVMLTATVVPSRLQRTIAYVSPNIEQAQQEAIPPNNAERAHSSR